MIIKLYLDELIKSGITLNDVETKSVEDYISSQSKPVKPEHLNHYKCLSVMRSLPGQLFFCWDLTLYFNP